MKNRHYKSAKVLPLTLLCLCFTYPIIGQADVASAKLKIQNDSTTELVIWLRKKTDSDNYHTIKTKKLSSEDKKSFSFNFGACGKTKKRRIEVRKPLSGGGTAAVVTTDITIKASRKADTNQDGNTCNATLTFDNCTIENTFKGSCSKDTRRKGKIEITNK